MKRFLKKVVWIIAGVVLLSAIGGSIEWFRRRGLRSWASQVGGTLETGGLIQGVAVPEAAAFDAGAKPDSTTYHNVVRFERDGVGYVSAQYSVTYRDFHNNVKTYNCVVCFITLPGADFPALSVRLPRSPVFTKLVGDDAQALPVKDAVAGFDARFAVRSKLGAPAPAPEALARFLPPAVQRELLAAPENLLAALQSAGAVVRLEAVVWETGYPHRELADVALRLAAAWRSTR